MPMITTERVRTFTCRTNAEWLGRRGVRFAADADGKPPIIVTNPPELDGRAHEWTPEDLLIGAIETCLLLTFASMVERQHLPVEGYTSEAEGTLELHDGSYRVSRITIKPTVVISDAGAGPRVLKSLAAAHRDCLVANSVSASVLVEPHVLLSACE